MTWWSTFPALLLALGALVLPGTILAAALGARGLSMIAVSPLLSVGVIGVGGVVGGVLGVGWGLYWLASCTAIFALMGWLLLRALQSRVVFRVKPISSMREIAGASAGLVIAASVIGMQLKSAMVRPDHIAQRYDNVFHLNAVRFVMETENASSLALGRMLNPDRGIAIYPASWHSAAALVADISGVSVPVAVNMLNISIAAVVWPLSCLFLTHVVFGARIFPLVLTGVLCTAFPAFPLALFEFGPLFPNMLSYSVLPAAVGLLVAVCKLGRLQDWHALGCRLSLLAGIAALLTTQPNGLVTLLAISVPVCLTAWSRWTPRFSNKYLRTGALIFAAGVFVLLWSIFLLDFDERQPQTTGGAALGEALTGMAAGSETVWIVAALVGVGITVLVAKRDQLWILGCFGVVAALYIVAASEPRGPLRMALTGAWYQDTPRLAAILPMVTILIGLVGATWIYDYIVSAIAKLKPERSFRHARAVVSGVIGVVLLAAALPIAFSEAIQDATAEARNSFSFADSKADILTIDERELIRSLPGLVPEGSVLGVNPWNGGALAYAYTGIEVSQFHMRDPTGPLDLVSHDLDTAFPGSASCTAARSLGIGYVLDFGSDYILDFDGAFLYPAFDDVGKDTAFSLVQRIGDAKLYAVSNCM